MARKCFSPRSLRPMITSRRWRSARRPLYTPSTHQYTQRSLSSAKSGDLFCKGERLKMRTAQMATDPFLGFLSGQLALRLHDGPFAVNPAGFNRIQPGAFDRQQAGDDTDPTFPLGSDVVFPEPTLDLLADVPGGIVPDQEQGFLSFLLQLVTDPVEEGDSCFAHGTPRHKPQQYPVAVVTQPPIARSSDRVRILRVPVLFHQSQGLASFNPAMEGWL